MSKHTPGPWHIDLKSPMTLGGDSREVYALVPGTNYVDRQICELMFDTDEWPNGEEYLQDVANARLIKASPRLLAACKLAIETMGYGTFCNGVVGPNGEREGEHLALLCTNELRAAILEAEPEGGGQ